MNWYKAYVFLIFFFIAYTFSGNTDAADIGLPLPGFEVDSTRSDLKREKRTTSREYVGPIYDTHAHLYPPAERNATRADIKKRELLHVLDLLKGSGVEHIIFMPTPNDGIRRNQELGVLKRDVIKALDSNVISNFCCSNYITNWLDNAYHNGYKQEHLQAILQRLTDDISSGNYAGIGEIGPYHFDKGYSKQNIIEFPLNFGLFLQIVDTITEKNMWIDIHAEPVNPRGVSYENEVFGGIELLYRRNPKLKLIYSHTAMTNPINARRILEKYPMVMMNVKIETKHSNWKNLEPVVNKKGELYEDWARLFEQMPNRFMVGTDFHFGRQGVPVLKYKKRIKLFRLMLGALNPDAARMVAFDNAQELFGLK